MADRTITLTRAMCVKVGAGSSGAVVLVTLSGDSVERFHEDSVIV